MDGGYRRGARPRPQTLLLAAVFSLSIVAGCGGQTDEAGRSAATIATATATQQTAATEIPSSHPTAVATLEPSDAALEQALQELERENDTADGLDDLDQAVE